MAQHKLEEEVNASTEVTFELERPSETHVYRVLHCSNCGGYDMQINLSDNGQWDIECVDCQDSACTLQKLLEHLK